MHRTFFRTVRLALCLVWTALLVEGARGDAVTVENALSAYQAAASAGLRPIVVWSRSGTAFTLARADSPEALAERPAVSIRNESRAPRHVVQVDYGARRTGDIEVPVVLSASGGQAKQPLRFAVVLSVHGVALSD